MVVIEKESQTMRTPEQCQQLTDVIRNEVAAAVHADVVVVYEAYRRLKTQGWTDPHPTADKDYNLLLIEAGSTGVHVGTCDGEEFGYWVVVGAGDLWPARPYLVKRIGKR